MYKNSVARRAPYGIVDNMKVIVGIGDTETDEARARANVGFMIVDALAKELGVDFSQDSQLGAQTAEASTKSGKMALVKWPAKSASSFDAVKQRYGVSNADVIVVDNDLAVPFGDFEVNNGPDKSDVLHVWVGLQSRMFGCFPPEDYLNSRFTVEGYEALDDNVIPDALDVLHGIVTKK